MAPRAAAGAGLCSALRRGCRLRRAGGRRRGTRVWGGLPTAPRLPRAHAGPGGCRLGFALRRAGSKSAVREGAVVGHGQAAISLLRWRPGGLAGLCRISRFPVSREVFNF